MKSKISIIIPIFNEEDFIEKCLDSIFESVFDDQSYDYEVLLSDGQSTDKTLSILRMLSNKYTFKLLTNSKRKQVYALNQMIKYASGDYIVRCDAHATYPKGYFKTLVNYLTENENVGNVAYRVNTVPLGDGPIESAIAFCLGSKFGVGSSHRTHETNNVEECDTVLFGAWRASIFKEVGEFDESFIRGQDLEHNIRIKKAGFKIVQIPGDCINYFSRNKLGKLSKMMMQYSSVKPAIYKKHSIFPNVRSFVPLLFVITLITLLYVSFNAFTVLILAYIFSAYTFSLPLLRSKGLKSYLVTPCVFFIQHISHAFGWFAGMYKVISNKTDWESTR